MDLSEDDIPGGALNQREPTQLKVEELHFWLRYEEITDILHCGKQQLNGIFPKYYIANAIVVVGDLIKPGRCKGRAAKR